MKKIEYAKLEESQESFLDKYETKSRRFTSGEEMAQVIETLGLKTMSGSQLQAMRNSVVRFYDNLMDKLRREGDSTRFLKRMNSMQSVTAVIDHTLYERGYYDLVF